MTQLEKFRQQNKFTYIQLQKHLEERGLTASDVTIGFWCKGIKQPRRNNAKILAVILNIPYSNIYINYDSEACTEGASESAPLPEYTAQTAG